MMELPVEHKDAPKTEIEQIVAIARQADDSLRIAIDPLYTQAESIVAVFKDGFQWSDFGSMIRLSFDFIKKNQGLTLSEQKDAVVKILSYIVDMTDTPYLPDEYTDGLFKSLLPPVVDIVTKASNGQLNLIPAISSEKPTAQTFKTYLLKVKEVFSDGFQWTDLTSCLGSTIDFVAGFPALTTEEKKQSVIDILDGVVDMTDTPYLPDNYVDPIFKSIVRSTVDLVFSYLETK